MLNIFLNLAIEFYNEGFLEKSTIASFVKTGALNPDNFKEITGDDYVDKTA